ncbi:hypothetical protein LOD99_8709 [Oopsacas minuta]|uniref:Uncharacterized protein n=1 Tax=Oopsacas minuta TaxID=111878 RepID=A0AAV7JFV4_9METZ|nr:hypothetical protein LOD99_8709 [Oopsacas minuta]
MRLALGLVLALALIAQLNGAQLDKYDYDVMYDDQEEFDDKNWFDNQEDDMVKLPQGGDEQMKAPTEEDIMMSSPQKDETLPESKTVNNGETFEELLAAKSSLLGEPVDEDTIDMNIFPREDEVDKSMFLSEKEMNLTGSRCSMPIHYPNRGGKRAVPGTRWVAVKSHKWLYATICRTCYGDIPGFYWGGYCYFEYNRRLYRTCTWDWTGLIYGKTYLYSRCHRSRCTIFGGYQKNYKNPWFLCVARHGGWLVPGKGDVYTRLCWYLKGRHSRNFYWLVAH